MLKLIVAKNKHACYNINAYEEVLLIKFIIANNLDNFNMFYQKNYPLPC